MFVAHEARMERAARRGVCDGVEWFGILVWFGGLSAFVAREARRGVCDGVEWFWIFGLV